MGSARTEFTRLLAEQLLGSDLDVESRLQIIAGSVLGTIADSLTVFLVDYDGAARVRVARHRDPALETAIGDVSEVYRPDPSALPGSPVPGALGGSERAVDWREVEPGDEVTRKAVERLGSKAWLAIPLRDVGGSVFGALRFSRGRDEPSFADDDIVIARQVATICGSALGHSRSVQDHRRAVERLSRDLAPRPLPTIPGLQLAVRYHSGTSQIGVGGDWCEALRVNDKALLAIGDAAGHGMEAAITMKEVASALRAFALVEGPGGIVRHLDRYVSTLQRTSLVTACVLGLDMSRLRVRVANAGHVPPIISSQKKGTRTIDRGRTSPLGTGVASKRFRSGKFRLRHGDRVFMYTDGLIERRGETIDVGIARLIAAIEVASRDLPKACDEILDAMAPPGGFTDDVAILAVELLREASGRYRQPLREKRWAHDEDVSRDAGRQAPPRAVGSPPVR